MRPRLIPIVMVSACLLLGVKLVDVWTVLRAHAAGAQPQTESHPQPPAKSEPAAPHGAPARGAAAAPSVDPAQADSSSPDPLLMSPEEIDLLQKLAAPRIELEKR